MSVSSVTGVSGLSLREILPDATFTNADDVRIRSCAGTLAECRKDDLFVALVNQDHDGHEDASPAIGRGAAAILTERLLPVSAPQCIVEDSRVAYGRICHALAGHPCGRIRMTGVSGTDGKTTTAHLVASILQAAGRPTGLHSSLHTSQQPRSGAADSDVTPPELAQAVAQMVTAGNEFGVVEGSSTELARHRLAGMELDVAVLTNLRGNRFEFHNTMANYRRSQLRLLEYLKPEGVVILNADDPATWAIVNDLQRPVLTTGIREAADVTGKVIETALGEQTLMITAGAESVMVRTRFGGLHHVYNCLAAAATALVYGIDLPTIARGLEDVRQLPGRMNLLQCGQPFSVVVDEATTPYRLGVALDTLKRNTTGRVICVFSSPEDADPRTASQFGRIAERASAVQVVTYPTARSHRGVATGLDYEPTHQVLDGFRNPGSAQVIPDRITAIEWALSQARPGDSILIAGRGIRPIASLSDGRWSLNDQEVCQSWLYGDSQPGQPIPVSVSPPSIFPIDHYRPC